MRRANERAGAHAPLRPQPWKAAHRDGGRGSAHALLRPDCTHAQSRNRGTCAGNGPWRGTGGQRRSSGQAPRKIAPVCVCVRACVRVRVRVRACVRASVRACPVGTWSATATTKVRGSPSMWQLRCTIAPNRPCRNACGRVFVCTRARMQGKAAPSILHPLPPIQHPPCPQPVSPPCPLLSPAPRRPAHREEGVERRVRQDLPGGGGGHAWRERRRRRPGRTGGRGPEERARGAGQRSGPEERPRGEGRG